MYGHCNCASKDMRLSYLCIGSCSFAAQYTAFNSTSIASSFLLRTFLNCTLEFTLHCIGSQGVSMIVVSHVSLKHRRSKVSCSLGKCIVLLVFHTKWAWHAFFLYHTVAKDIHFSMQDRIFSQYLLSLRPLACEVLEIDLMSDWPLQPHHPQLPFSFV